MSSAAPPRRTQEERSQTTRRQLLDATIICLYELGYANTTTTEIANRAGVSRGAQLHHFPTKISLVTTALDHVFQRRHREFREAIEKLPAGSDRIGAAIDLLWEMISSPTYYAWLELVVAARTDPELREKVQEISARFDKDAQDNFIRIFGLNEKDAANYSVTGMILFATLEGMSAARIAMGEHPDFPKVIELLKTMARMTLPPAEEK